MGEHKQPVKVGQKAKWDALRGVDLRHKRYIWRSSTEGTFKYKGLYGALKTRRRYKQARLWLKYMKPPIRGAERDEVMRNVMGLDD